MHIIIRNSSGTPIYEQIVAQIKDAILTGGLAPGEALPSMRLLAKELKISVITTKRAYEELERDGYIKTLPGRGSIVRIENRDHLLELHRQEMQGWLERAVSAARAAGVSRQELLEQIGRLYDRAEEEE